MRIDKRADFIETRTRKIGESHFEIRLSKTMLIVRFVRIDGAPNEEYYYRHLNDALYHIHLFKGDDSGYYKRIELVFSNSSRGFEEIAYTLEF